MHLVHIDRMKLDHYLSEFKVNETAFAEDVGCSQSNMNRIRRGVIVPSPQLAKAIEGATNGLVAIADLYADVPSRAAS
jgi:DNA-binding transcriptional regulator YdaS (Cro superfamily)